ncbi:conserved hypothetical protein [Candida tropicalis MYA-3404]|uniref:Programmed cell death protein 2 C-terminal domain-containing protein n=1 Tax=Candida tropicalis (strain ATCC MYA-3404 / T1) TaxID=294747 RepID=C5MFZ9_CANTT|nr:conserved hypothetical protein [Candida tropicalis MYA-3404]EER31262.1 conserved hypothetical protein [Candida tropicalis MYA-3404]KAG4404828.1 hypothetical protein JTP64_005842 [Candida tropicalis]
MSTNNENEDVYSSDEESFDESSKSQVLLGFVDAPIIYNQEENGDDDDEEEELPTIEDTFIGGQPVWLHPESKPPQKLVTCDLCNQEMALYLQAFAPISGKLYDRVIYVFGCKNTKSCSGRKGSIKAIRGIIKDKETIEKIKLENQQALQKDLDAKLKLDKQKKLNEELTKDLFKKTDTSSNPFGGNSNPFSNPFGSNPFDKKAEEPKKPESTDKKTTKTPSYADVASTNAPKPKPVKKFQGTLPEYKGYFVYVENERFKKGKTDPDLEKYKHLIEQEGDGDFDDGDISEKVGTSMGFENPQAGKIANMLQDKCFEKFTNVVQENPGQVLRYGGQPLWYSSKIGHPPSGKKYELQLMPKAIMDLEGLDGDIIGGMSWGTIVVFTSEDDFIPEENFDKNDVGYVEESAFVQWE